MTDRRQAIRELLLAEHALQRALVEAGVAKPSNSYQPRFTRILGGPDSARRRVIRMARPLLRQPGALPGRIYQASRWRFVRLVRKATGRPVNGPTPFSDSQRRARQRQAEEYQRIAFPKIEELRGVASSKRCFILGNGPSLAGVDLSALESETVFVTNWFANHEDAHVLKPDYYCICSHELFGGWGQEVPHFNDDLRQRIEALEDSTTLVLPFRFMPYVESGGLFDQHDRRYLLFDRPKAGIDTVGSIETDLSQPLHDGYTVIITYCLPLAKWLGFKEIYLLGVDSNYGISSPSDPKQYFYDSKLHTSSTSKFESLDRIWAPEGPVFQNYEIVRRQFESDGVRIMNLTPGGRLDVFDRMSLDEVLAADGQ